MSKKLLFLFLSVFVFNACQLMDRETTQKRKEIRDTNYQTRKEESGPKKRLAILPFIDPNPNRPATIKDKARSVFILDLNRSGDMIGVPTEDIKIDFAKFFKNNEYDMKELVKQSQNSGVTAFMEGKILDIRVKRDADKVGVIRKLNTVFEAKIQARIVSIRGGREIFNTVKTVTLEEGNYRVAERVESDQFVMNNPELIEMIVKDAFLDFVPQIVAALDKVAWEGRIAAINGERLYLNVGRISGLQVGDLLKVTDEGEDVYDPESGNHIGRVPGRMKGTLEVISYFGTDGSVSVIHSGSGFRENDRVELYQ